MSKSAKRMILANVCLLIGAMMEYASVGGHKVVPFYFMTIAALLAIDEIRESFLK